MSNFRSPHVLYRMFDDADVLLYVGKSCTPGGRMNSHKYTDDWWHEVSRITIEHHPDRLALKTAKVARQRTNATRALGIAEC